jgi:hypothetical protein
MLNHKTPEPLRKPLKTEATREATTLRELEATTPARKSLTPLLEEELLTAATGAKGRAVEGVLLLFRVVRVVAVVKPLLEFWIGEDFVGLVDGGHFLLCFLGGHIVCGGFVGVVELGEFAVCLLDVAIFGIARDTEDLVVVLLFGALQ